MLPTILFVILLILFGVAIQQATASQANTRRQQAFVIAAVATGLLLLLYLRLLTGTLSPMTRTVVLLLALLLILLSFARFADNRIAHRVFLGIELLVIVLWALFAARPLLNMDPNQIFLGIETMSIIPSNHFWTRVQMCGWCAMWDGSLRGGAPAMANMYTSMLHPVVALPTIALGVVNGSKVAAVGALALGGWAQWWLAYELRLGRVARVWSGCIAVVAGHLSSRLELGALGMVVSTVACAMVIPPFINVLRTGSRRMTVVLGVMGALAIVSGQGYMQIALLGVLPAFVFLLPFDNRAHLLRVISRCLLAAVIALLLAAPFLIPLFRYLPDMNKFTSQDLGVGQPFTYTLFNLVISDPDYFKAHLDLFHKQAHAWLYGNYIGWVPVLFALWTLRGGRTPYEQWALYTLLTMAFVLLFIGSDGPLRLLAEKSPDSLAEKLRGIRYYPLMIGLAIPAILGISAIGLDMLADRLSILRPWRGTDYRIVLSIPLLAGLLQGLLFSGHWLQTRSIHPEVFPVITRLQTHGLQWVDVEGGYKNHDFIEPAIDMGLKLGDGFRTWNFKERKNPHPILLSTTGDPPAGMRLIDTVAGVGIYETENMEERLYARVVHKQGPPTPCIAYGVGGAVDVLCDTTTPGRLEVREHSLSGWTATVDGQPVPLLPTPWLHVTLPPGHHEVWFRYRPWDVLVGLGLCAVGIVLSVGLWRAGRADL